MPFSSPAAQYYINPIDLVTYYDERRVLQLASDTGTAAALADLSNTSSAAYAFVLQAILTAASDVDTHCQQGQWYNRTTLESFITYAVANPTDQAGLKRAALLTQLVADLAFGVLASRRGYGEEALKLMAPRYEMALLTLERLATGVQIFDNGDPFTAGVPMSQKIGVLKYRPSSNNRMFLLKDIGVPGQRWGVYP